MTYMPEVGQMLFGNATGEYEAPHGYVSDVVAALDHALIVRGQEFHYYEDYDADGLIYRGYYWGDCHCGFENAEYEFDKNTPHSDNCRHRRYEALPKLEKSFRPVPIFARRFCEEEGLEYTKYMYVECNCARKEAMSQWYAEHGHSVDCRTVLPNLEFDSVKFWWYKYPGRGESTDTKWPDLRWKVWRKKAIKHLMRWANEEVDSGGTDTIIHVEPLVLVDNGNNVQ